MHGGTWHQHWCEVRTGDSWSPAKLRSKEEEHSSMMRSVSSSLRKSSNVITHGSLDSARGLYCGYSRKARSKTAPMPRSCTAGVLLRRTHAGSSSPAGHALHETGQLSSINPGFASHSPAPAHEEQLVSESRHFFPAFFCGGGDGVAGCAADALGLAARLFLRLGGRCIGATGCGLRLTLDLVSATPTPITAAPTAQASHRLWRGRWSLPAARLLAFGGLWPLPMVSAATTSNLRRARRVGESAQTRLFNAVSHHAYMK